MLQASLRRSKELGNLFQKRATDSHDLVYSLCKEFAVRQIA